MSVLLLPGAPTQGGRQAHLAAPEVPPGTSCLGTGERQSLTGSGGPALGSPVATPLRDPKCFGRVRIDKILSFLLYTQGFQMELDSSNEPVGEEKVCDILDLQGHGFRLPMFSEVCEGLTAVA